MKRIILTGGIGNQLFKSLGAIQASSANLQAISFDITWYQARTFINGVTATRRFELSNFPAFSKVPLKVRNPKIAKLENHLINSQPEMMERFGYQIRMNSSNKVSRAPRIFKCDFEDIGALPDPSDLLEFLKFPKITSTWSQTIKKITLIEKAIAVHVRREDYLTFSEIYPRLGLSYYKSSLDHMYSKLGNLPIWLFSDDPIGVLKEFGDSIKFDRIIIPPPEVPMVEVLELFSLMNGVVTANSTFSWWGAYIGTLSGNVAHVTIPEKFTNLENDPGLKLRVPDWEVIPN